ncbi:MAG: c-type cytochrome [Cyanobacteria bacterium J06632_3]
MPSFFRRVLPRPLFSISTTFNEGVWLFLSLLLCTGIFWGMSAPPALATPTSLTSPPAITATTPATSRATLFEQNCAGCHINGGNVIRRGKNLKKRAMLRNGYDTVDAIAQIITQGKGIMSGYSDRLNAEEIDAIAQYVHEQSESGW